MREDTPGCGLPHPGVFAVGAAVPGGDGERGPSPGGEYSVFALVSPPQNVYTIRYQPKLN